MRTVNVAELRSRLSAYLGRVRSGEEILIRDRNLAVAKIVPLSKAEDFDEELLELAAQGQLRLPERSLDLRSFFALPAPNIAVDKLRAVIEQEREED
jgi:prevent-host-death family protein